jgi:5S rRNA maturation endonuclease (ribonuclease M5)
MISKVTEDCINEIQDHLMDYIIEHSSKSKNRRFTCFNKHAHKHNDEDPSASIVPRTNGRFWTCFSCGAKGDILNAVQYKEGIEGFNDQIRFLSEKYSIKIQREGTNTTAANNNSQGEENRSIINSSNFNGVGEEVHLRSNPKSNTPNYHKKITANYYYEDEKGKGLYKICRREWMEEDQRKKDFMAYSKEKNGWSFGIKNTRHVIYKLPQVLKSISADEIIFFVEGEKCVDHIFQLGLIGTTTAFGARGFSTYSKDYASSLKGASVVILPDNDENGRAYATDVVNALKQEAKSIKVLELPGLKLKGDIVDWIEAGGTKEELIFLVNNTKEVAVEESTIQEKGIGNIFEDEFCYYKYHKEQRINISNFIINPKYYIDNEVDTQIIGDIVTEGGVIEDRVFKTTDFDDVISFRKALNSFKTLYVGRVEDLQYIRFLISSKSCDVKKGVTYSGFHKHNNQWCFVSEQGTLNFQGNVMEDIILQNQYAELNTNILKQDAITREELVLIAPYLFKFSILKNTAAILGYVSGLFLKEKLKNNNIQYNHLLIEGESSSGKSSAVKYVITPMLSMEDGILNAGQCTDFALNKTASSSNFIPLILEEYKPHIIGKYKVDLISGVMRNSYDNYKGIKGVATLDKNRSFIPRASVILSGEVGIEETANVGRSLRVIFATSYFNEETKESLEKLKENSNLLNKLGRSLLKEGLKMDEKKVKELQREAFKELTNKSIKSDRVKNSISNCILGIALLKSVFDDLDLDMQESTGFSIKDIVSSIERGAYEDLLDSGSSNKTVIEQSFETMNRMAANNLLSKGIDYDAVVETDSGDHVLRLNYTSFYDRFVKYCREHNVTHEVLPLNSFKKQLSNMLYCKCYNKPVNFSVRLENLKDRKTFRSAVIYISKLREKNVDIDFMVDDDMSNVNFDE